MPRAARDQRSPLPAMKATMVCLLALFLGLHTYAYDETADPSVVNGQEAPPFKYTDWMLGLIKLRANSSNYRASCGASYIGDNTVLTAAHCVETVRNISRLKFEARRHNWNDSTEKGVLLHAEQIVIHPQYNSSTLEYDAAIVKLKGELQLTSYLKLDNGSYSDESQPRVFTVLGWGSTLKVVQGQNEVLLSPTLQQADVELVSQTSCQESYATTAWDILPSMLCAKRPEIDSCDGDSGGPLFLDGNPRVLVGLVSFGKGCAQPEPGVYTRVSAIRSFIDGTMGCPSGTSFTQGRCQ